MAELKTMGVLQQGSIADRLFPCPYALVLCIPEVYMHVSPSREAEAIEKLVSPYVIHGVADLHECG